MVKLFAPAMSLDAAGTVADAMTFSKWKGRNYLRKRSTPANPKSGLQVGIRAMFRFVSQNWAARSAAEKATWQTAANARTISPFNAFLAENVQRWKRFRSPAMESPVGETGTLGSVVPGWPLAIGGTRSINIQTGYMADFDNWGALIFRGNTGFSTALSNCIGVILADNAIDFFYWLDTPLEPGTYFYNYRSFTDAGLLGPELGEFSGVATA